MLKHFGLASLIAVAASASATAQNQPSAQTPENAQRFLTINLPHQFTVQRDTSPVIAASRTSEPSAARGPCFTDFNGRLGSGDDISWGINWAETVAVRHAENSPAVQTQDRARFVRTFDFGSAELAARAAFAMEFLRQHCDPSAGTGF